MVGHEHEGMNIATPAPGRAVQECQVSLPIFVVEEASLAIVTALGDVLRDADKIEPARPGHDRTPVMDITIMRCRSTP
jgi:hypothetical protein